LLPSLRFAGLIKGITITLLLITALVPNMAAEKKTRLRGRVLAAIDSMHSESGTSYRYQQFIFGVESSNHQGQEIVTPVLITYSLPTSGDFLTKSFYDYSKLYELRAFRRANSDTPLESIAYIRYMSFDNREIDPPTLILRLLDGVPKDILKMDMVLPNYELFSGDYRIIKTKKAR
jgi:hypothetical protein